MEKILMEEKVSDIETLNIEKTNKIKEYNEIIRSCNAFYDKRSELKRESAGMKKYIDLSVEDRLEKITSVWALFTAIFSYDFLTFWGGNPLDSFLTTMFCAVPISTIAFYMCEIIFYNKFVQLLSVFSAELRSIYSKYDALNEDIKKTSKDIESMEINKKSTYSELVSLQREIDKRNSEIISLPSIEQEIIKPKVIELEKEDNELVALNPIESDSTVIVEGFTFKKRKTRKR